MFLAASAQTSKTLRFCNVWLSKSVPPLPGTKRVQNEPIYINDFNTKIATIKMPKRCPQANVLPALHSFRAVAFATQALSRASRFRAARDKRFKFYVETLPARLMC